MRLDEGMEVPAIKRYEVSSVNALTNRGRAKGALQDAQGALADCTEALKLDPKSIRALSTQGRAKVCLQTDTIAPSSDYKTKWTTRR